MGTLRVYAVTLDTASTFIPDQLSPADFGEVAARYRMDVGCGSRRISVQYAVAVEHIGRDEEHVSALPEHTHEFMLFLLALGGEPFHSAVKWLRVLGSVVKSVHRGFDRVFPTEFTTDAEPDT